MTPDQKRLSQGEELNIQSGLEIRLKPVVVMVCGSAAGELAPIYVNYKAEKMWSTWTENGPPGARYNRTKSGWFDHKIF